jgi:hypothetical protein
MNWKGSGRKSSVRISGTNPKFACRHYGKLRKKLIQNKRSSGRELSPSHREHGTGVSAIRSRHSVVAQEKLENLYRFPEELTRSARNRCVMVRLRHRHRNAAVCPGRRALADSLLRAGKPCTDIPRIVRF